MSESKVEVVAVGGPLDGKRIKMADHENIYVHLMEVGRTTYLPMPENLTNLQAVGPTIARVIYERKAWGLGPDRRLVAVPHGQTAGQTLDLLLAGYQAPSSNLTRAQTHVLLFCRAHPGWCSLLEMDQIRLLEDGDALVVPSLVQRGLLVHQASIRAVAITAAGQLVAEEIHARQKPASSS